MTKQKTFNTAVSPTAEAEAALTEWKIPFTKQLDGTLMVEGSINISDRELEQLPDLSCVIVKGSFLCDTNCLTNLKGAPQQVGGNFWCENNQLTSLAGAPQKVGFSFFCYNNRLAHLEGLSGVKGPILSDLGAFDSWAKVPEELKTSPETKQKFLNATDVGKGLTRPLPIRRRLVVKAKNT